MQMREDEALKLHTIDGLTTDAIAERYGVQRPAVNRWIRNARERLVAPEMQNCEVCASEHPIEAMSINGDLWHCQACLGVCRAAEDGGIST